MGHLMKQTAVVIAPGRGTYNKAELGYLSRRHPDKAELFAQFDQYRADLGQKTVSELDGAPRYSLATHTRGDNASALIYASAYADFQSIDRDQFDVLAIAINTGTNLPSVATPNGQAAFLFLLTSALAPLIRLSYLKMLWMALPYTIVLSSVGMIAIYTAF